MKKLINKYNIISILLIIIFIIILVDVKINYITEIDRFGYNIFVDSLRNDNLTNVMKVLTNFGGAAVLISIIFITYILIKNKKDALYGMINIGLALMINDFLKFIIARPRPSGYNIITESNYSMPSSHAMISTAVYGYLIYLIYKRVHNKVLKYFLISLLSLIIIIVCISRVYLGVHYLTDVIEGILLAVAYLIIYIRIIGGLNETKNNKNKI